MRVPLALLSLPYLAGTAAGVAIHDVAPSHLLAAAACAAVLALIATAGFYLETHAPAFCGAAVIAGTCAGVATGLSHAREIYRPSILEWFGGTAAAEEPVLLEGILREDAAGSGALLLWATRVTPPGGSSIDVRGGVRLFVGGEPRREASAEWRAGRRLRASALLRVPGTFANPGVPDDRRLQARRGVVLTGTVKSASLVEVAGRGGPIEELAARVRARVREGLHARVGAIDPRSAAIAIAILIGDRTGLSPEDERRLQDAGTYHVIAISGGNIAILTVLLVLLGRTVGVPSRTAAVLAIGVLLFYGEIAGGAASVGRAITAAVVILAARALDHRGSVLNVLCVAVLGAVLAAPAVSFDAGFLLSFGATLGIVVGVPRLTRPAAAVRPVWRPWDGVARAAAGVFAATICAEIVLMPISASLFSRVTAAGLILNFVAIPLMTVVQCGAMALLALGEVHDGIARGVATVVHLAAFWLVESSRLVDLAPWLARDVPPPAWWLLAAYYASVVLLVTTGPRRPLIAVALLGGLLIVSGPRGAVRGEVPQGVGVLRVVVLDVGQGDAVLISTPGRSSVLVDTGGLAGTTFDIGRRVVLPALRALGVRRLDALVLTHGDPDHIGGAEVVLQRLSPLSVWEGIAVPPHDVLRRLAGLASAARVPWRTVRPGVVDRWGDVSLRVLHPSEPGWERQRVRNDDSVVLDIRYGDVSILLPGDIGAEVERALVPSLEPAPVVILKAAHHGSATSTSEAFLDAVHPAAVIFSAGRGNRFGHPAKVVVERVERRGIPAFNTAADGAVFVESDGVGVAVWGWESGRRVWIGGQPPH